MNILRRGLAILFSLLIIVPFVIIGFIFYQEVSNPVNIILVIATTLLGVKLAVTNYQMMISRGIFNILSYNNHSPELDDLIPTLSSGVTNLEANGFTQFQYIEFLTNKSYKISIWGDQNEKQLNIKHKLNQIAFDDKSKILTFNFDNGKVLKVRNPRKIFSTESYVKIMFADEVLWQFLNEKNQIKQFIYSNNGTKINTRSNTVWKPKRFDLGIGMHALYLQG